MTWLRPLAQQTGNGQLAAGRRDARDLIGFRNGIRALSRPVDVVIKVDADIDFDPDFCERLTARFAADEQLGIASGTCYELERGSWVRRAKTDTTVWGATRAYRAECIDDMMELEPCMGWDGLDEIRVQLRGMRTQTCVDLPVPPPSPGGRAGSSPRSTTARLWAAPPGTWATGPATSRMRALYRARREPAALAMLWGYAAAAASRAPRAARTSASYERCASASAWARRCAAAPRPPESGPRPAPLGRGAGALEVHDVERDRAGELDQVRQLARGRLVEAQDRAGVPVEEAGRLPERPAPRARAVSARRDAVHVDQALRLCARALEMGVEHGRGGLVDHREPSGHHPLGPLEVLGGGEGEGLIEPDAAPDAGRRVAEQDLAAAARA